MFFVFEMANNHMGSVEHGKLLIETFGKLAKKYGINAGIKLQFRNLPTFIHKDFKDSDLKYVKRFNETALTEYQFKILLDCMVENNLKTVVTPFDNESLPMIERLGVDVVKVASCSIDDWPLLDEVSEIDKKIIISTGGADFDTLRKVYRLFKSKGRDFAFMHCVGEYPTPNSHANLQRIRDLKYEFSDIQVGLSTHEPPAEKSIVPLALAMGCDIVEKHIAIPNVEEGWKPNEYSCTPEQIEDLFKEIVSTQKTIDGKSDNEIKALASLKRGVYVKSDLEKGHLLTSDDLYYSMPLQEGQLDASYYNVIGRNINNEIIKDSPLMKSDVTTNKIRIIDPADRFDLSYAFANNFSSLGKYKSPLVEMVEVAKDISARSALVHLDEVEELVKLLKGSNVRPEVLIDFPDGMGGVNTKKIQAQLAKDLGAVGGDMVINLHAVQRRDKKRLMKEFKTVVNILGEVKVIAQIPYLWKYDRDAIKWIIDIAVESGIYCIKDWTTRENFLLPDGDTLDYADNTRVDYIKFIQNYISDNNLPLIIKIAGRVTTDNSELFINSGATLVGISYRKANTLRKTLINSLDLIDNKSP
jgi:deoxyribose-phosphate aldolase